MPIFYVLELIEEVKIGISRNALLHWNEIFMKFSKIYTFFRFDQGKVCLCKCKLNASGQEIGKELELASLTLTFKEVFARLLNPSSNKSYNQTGHKRPRGIKDHSPIIYLLELIEEVKIGISKNALLH